MMALRLPRDGPCVAILQRMAACPTGARLRKAGPECRSTSTWPTAARIAGAGTAFSALAQCRTNSCLSLQSAHFQSLACNTSNGGIERRYEPFSIEIVNGASLRTILKEARAVFEQLSSNRTWHIEAHQFRIEVFANEIGNPTPEGIHRDGVAFGMVMMIDRTNVLNGETTIYRNRDGDPIGQFTLLQPLACLLFEDTKVCHAVSSIVAENPARRGTRDVLVITFSTTRRCTSHANVHCGG